METDLILTTSITKTQSESHGAELSNITYDIEGVSALQGLTYVKSGQNYMVKYPYKQIFLRTLALLSRPPTGFVEVSLLT